MGCQFSLKSSFYGWSQLPRRISRLEHTYFNKVCLNLSNWCSISVWLAWSVDVYQTWMSRNVEESRYVEKCREMSSFENFWWSVQLSCLGLGGAVWRSFGLGGAVWGWMGVFGAGWSRFGLVPIGDFDITRRDGDASRNVEKCQKMLSFVEVATGGT